VRRAALGLAAGALVLAACGGGDPQLDLVFVSIDTLRADRVGAYGYERNTTPAIDRLAEESTVFETVVAESPWTLPSHVTMLSGLYPSTHSVTDPSRRTGSELRLLAEALHSAGYRTFGWTAGGYVTDGYGFDQGFEFFDGRATSLEKTIDAALDVLHADAGGAPLFLFLHTYAVHCPYHPEPPYDRLFRSEDAVYVSTEGRCGHPDYETMALSPGQYRYLSDRYDGSIREADAEIERLFAYLRESGRMGETVVAVVSDHGEEFGEHGRVGHRESLHRELLLVPFVLHVPGRAPARVSRPTGLVDVTPTLLDAVGLPALREAEGRSLLALGGPPSGPRVSELDWRAHLRSVYDPPWHWIDGDTTGLYHAREDPPEQEDRAGEHPAVVERLRRALERYAEARTPREAPVMERLPPARRRQLRALGYLE